MMKRKCSANWLVNLLLAVRDIFLFLEESHKKNQGFLTWRHGCLHQKGVSFY